MAGKLPILDLKRSYAAIKDEIEGALFRVLESQSFILGREVRSFEEHVESYLEKGWAAGCASGTDALLLALMALDVGPGDEVVTTPYSFFATAGSIVRLGATPVFADIDPATYNIDLKNAVAQFGPKTKAFLPVHLFGQTVPLEEITDLCRERGIAVVEDAAQAFGSWRRVRRNGEDRIVRAGVMGDVGCYSFFPTKNLGACGDAGMVVAADEELGKRVKKLRVHGEGAAYFHEEVGLNSRLDALQAAILDVKFRYLETWNAERRVLADRYRMFFAMKKLEDFVQLPKEEEGNFHIYHQYVVRVSRRDALMAHLEERGFSTRVYYPLPLHLQKCFAFLGYRPGDFPESERLAQEALALPIFVGLLPEEQENLVNAIAEFFVNVQAQGG
ncbi:MAG: DegT/DnrJ/EryC1/StrS family aminotransferase [Synergistaceae bacterium]|jgi:dTDP-4-amino-4,6-dideoxygalactose transaminase|nr:DegT/DnrJ/EryC1/StrS family aminotransferase [Synergistaceae bacterium]